MKKFQRIRPLIVLILALMLSVSIPLSARAGYDELFDALKDLRQEARGDMVAALEYLANGNREAAITEMGEVQDIKTAALFLINQWVLAQNIDAKTAKTLKSIINKDSDAFLKAYNTLLDYRKSQDKILAGLKNANQTSTKNDASINKTAAKLGLAVITLSDDSKSAGFHNPNDIINYVITGLPQDCCDANCVNVSTVSTAYNLHYTPVDQTIIGNPCTGKFSVKMGPHQGGAVVIVEVNGKEYKRVLYNYGNKPGGKTTTADYQGCYIGEAWGNITVQTPEGPIPVRARSSVSFCLDAKGQGVVAANHEYGAGSGSIKISSGGGASIKTSGSIGAAGASVTWSGSFILARDGVAYGNGTWSIKFPGGGGGGWSISRRTN